MDEVKPIIQIIQKNTGLSEQDATMFHLPAALCSRGGDGAGGYQRQLRADRSASFLGAGVALVVLAAAVFAFLRQMKRQ
ncbi:MAG: hypothetical protein ACI3XJ_10405 [Oscillospiraceae bacterium]